MLGNTSTGTNNGFFSARWKSMWLQGGTPSAGSTPPTTATVPTNTTAGCLQQKNPNSGQQLWLLNYSTTSPLLNLTGFRTMLYDRLIHISGFSANTTNLQTVNLTGLTRYSGTSSAGNRATLEVYSALGTTERNATISYTNQDGVSGRLVTIKIGGIDNTNAAFQLGATVILPLVSGDTGVRSVETVQLDGSTTTQGNFGFCIIRPLTTTGTMFQSSTTNIDLIYGIPSLVEIKANACLSMMSIFNATSNTGGSTDAYLQYFNGMIQLVNK